MDEEKIFGPLTLRQFLYLGLGLILCYVLYKYLSIKISIPAIIVLLGIVIVLILNAPKVVIDENYIKIKKATSKTPEEFDRWAQKKIAMIQFQISLRQEKGLIPDPALESTLNLFKSYLNSK